MHQIETTHVQGGTACAPVPSGLGMNRAAQSFRKESVTLERAMRNTHMHTQVGVTRWARQDSTPQVAKSPAPPDPVSKVVRIYTRELLTRYPLNNPLLKQWDI